MEKMQRHIAKKVASGEELPLPMAKERMKNVNGRRMQTNCVLPLAA
jgi:hypothetical protein